MPLAIPRRPKSPRQCCTKVCTGTVRTVAKTTKSCLLSLRLERRAKQNKNTGRQASKLRKRLLQATCGQWIHAGGFISPVIRSVGRSQVLYQWRPKGQSQVIDKCKLCVRGRQSHSDRVFASHPTCPSQRTKSSRLYTSGRGGGELWRSETSSPFSSLRRAGRPTQLRGGTDD